LVACSSRVTPPPVGFGVRRGRVPCASACDNAPQQCPCVSSLSRRPLKISLVTATFNSAATVLDTLRSVNGQTHQDVEHIVVDGGSSDATMEIVRAEGLRVTTALSEPDRGI